MRLALRRIVAWLVNWACILGWVAFTLAIGLPLYQAGIIHPTGTITLNVIAAIVVVVPVVLFAALFESRARAATPGKRAMHLQVRSRSLAPGFGRAVARNAMKIGLPWIIGHASVYAIIQSSSRGQSPPVGVWILVAVAYALPLVSVASLCVADGRTPYDRLTRTVVTASTLAPSDVKSPNAT